MPRRHEPTTKRRTIERDAVGAPEVRHLDAVGRSLHDDVPMRDPRILEHHIAVRITPEDERALGEHHVRAVVRSGDTNVHEVTYARPVPIGFLRRRGDTRPRGGNLCAAPQRLRAPGMPLATYRYG